MLPVMRLTIRHKLFCGLPKQGAHFFIRGLLELFVPQADCPEIFWCDDAYNLIYILGKVGTYRR